MARHAFDYKRGGCDDRWQPQGGKEMSEFIPVRLTEDEATFLQDLLVEKAVALANREYRGGYNHVKNQAAECQRNLLKARSINRVLKEAIHGHWSRKP